MSAPLHPHGTLRARFEPVSKADIFRRLGIGARSCDLGDEGLYLAEELVAADVGWLGSSEHPEALAIVVLALMIAQRQGSTRLPLATNGPLRALVADIARVAGVEVDVARVMRTITNLTRAPRFNSVIGVGDARLPLVVDLGCLYTERSRWLEQRVAGRIAERLRATGPAPAAVERALVDASPARPLDAAQLEAVRLALSNKIAVVTGGPGTGKTLVAAAILRGFAKLGIVNVALAAQTGKAANRLTEVIADQLAPHRVGPPEHARTESASDSGAGRDFAVAHARTAESASPSEHERAVEFAALSVPASPSEHARTVESGALSVSASASVSPSERTVEFAALASASASRGRAADPPERARTVESPTPSERVRTLESASSESASSESASSESASSESASEGASAVASFLAAASDRARVLPGAGSSTAAGSREAPVAQTLHRLLGYRGGRFAHHALSPLPVDAVIVDEASMLDLELVDALLDALPVSAPLVLIGDAHQLPAIDAGQILADLTVAGGAAASRVAVLAKSYRQDTGDADGRAVYEAAQVIHRGEVQRLFEAKHSLATTRSPNRLLFRGVELVDTQALPRPHDATLAVADQLWHHFDGPRALRTGDRVFRFVDGAIDPAQRDELEQLWRLLARARILTVTRALPTGSIAINDHVHDIALDRLSVSGRPEFVPGEPVIVTKNDYQRGLFNGDQGIVVRADEGLGRHHYRAVFRCNGVLRPFAIEALRDRLELAWALTIHKSQGSELDAVALLLPHEDLPLVTRELLYTGVTRARTGVVIAGSRPILVNGCKRRALRHSGLAERLDGMLA